MTFSEEVGGSKTTLYSYYGGKEGLFAATVGKICHDKLGPLLAMDLTDLDPETASERGGQAISYDHLRPGGSSLFPRDDLGSSALSRIWLQRFTLLGRR